MAYQSKNHKLICDALRYTSFALVILTLLSYLAFVWVGMPDKMFQGKMILTTLCVLFSSVVVGIIFHDKQPKNSEYQVKKFVIRKDTNHRLSQAVRYGDTVYISGQVAIQNRGKSITDQTNEILGAIEKYLAETGSDKNHMLSATVWLSDMASYDEFNKVWDAWVPQGQAPSRACVEAKLVFPDFNVEVAVIAAAKE